MNPFRSLLLISFVGCGFVLSGCSGASDQIETHPTTGVIQVDGKPLADATITFFPKEGPPARAKTDADGRFSLTTYANNDGAVASEHKVTIVKLEGGDNAGDMTDTVEQGGDPSAAASEEVKSAVPAQYQTAQFTPLKFEIPHDGEILIEL